MAALLQFGWWLYLDNSWEIADITIQLPIAKSTMEATHVADADACIGRKLYPIAKIATPKAMSARLLCMFLIPPNWFFDCPALPVNQSTAVKIWQISIVKWFVVIPRYATMTYVKVALWWIIAQYHAITECLCSSNGIWFPMVGVPTASRIKAFTTRSAPVTLSIPSPSYNNSKESHFCSSSILFSGGVI